jgi:hypothetical protein
MARPGGATRSRTTGGDGRPPRSRSAGLGTTTIKDTVNGALRLVGAEHLRSVSAALDVLADATLDDCDDAWR